MSQQEENRTTPPRPRPRRRRRRKMGAWGAMMYVMLVIGASALLAGLAWIAAGDVLALNKAPLTATITLSEDVFTYKDVEADGKTKTIATADMGHVAKELAQNDLVEYPWLFQLFASVTHAKDDLAPGTYTLNSTMDYRALVSGMSAKSSAKTEVTVTIPEGSTSAQVFALLEKNGVATVSELESTAASHDFKFSFLQNIVPLGEANRLEGYLFPDTYQFFKGMDPVSALNKMLLRFDQVMTADLRQEIAANGQTMAEIITIASLIEKETTGDDQTHIASVIYNRLNKPTSETAGFLNIDATIQYILPQRKGELTGEDLKIDSPYNTSLYKGLPAGPIANPGQAAIRAAMHPDKTGDYFYALGDDKTHHFFKTYARQKEFTATQELYKNAK
ncbi:MAG: endolytic transglycosylase MltG [Pseudoflavonifractor sp.]